MAKISCQKIISNGQDDYNHVRPHSSLGYETPTSFAAQNQDQQQAVSACLITGALPPAGFPTSVEVLG